MHKEYVDVLDTNKSISRDASSIRSFNHQIYTFKQSKIALTSFYDKMQMINKVNCDTYGPNPNNNTQQIFKTQNPTRKKKRMTKKRC